MLEGRESQWSRCFESLAIVRGTPGIGVDVYVIALVGESVRLSRIACPAGDEHRAREGCFPSRAGDVERIVTDRGSDTGSGGSVAIPTARSRVAITVAPVVGIE